MGKSSNSHGLFGYHKLMSWFLNDFSSEERADFRKAYGENGMGYSFERLISGEETPLMKGKDKEAGVVDLLSTILHKILFKSNYPIDIAEKVIMKIHSLIDDKTDVLEKHFAYLHEIEFYKKQMKSSHDYEARYVQACLNMISIAKEARKAFEEDGDGRLPNNRAFFELSDYYHSKKMFKEAAWVEENSINLWDRSVGIDYEEWLEHLIKSADKKEASRVYELFIEEYGEEENSHEYKERIESIK